ncbi:MAG: hypothetical protein K1X67_10465 [Fimbriimonadaceae bacterium]|nr:hypothetical protein [Fimbriimonadaceae bacterium]
MNIVERPLATSSPVSSYDEWGKLREIIVGRPDGGRIATADRGLFAVEYLDLGAMSAIPSGPYPQWIIDETEEDLQAFIKVLEQFGAIVRRPELFDHSKAFSTPDWTSDGQYNYCPRDLFVVAGETIIEAPMTLRARQYETTSYKSILLDYLDRGARWISAPKPRLLDSAYQIGNPNALAITEVEPIFDAANVLRIGRDILYLVSDSGNRIGAKWLQSALGSDFRVHAYENLYRGTHVDTTLALIRPGLVVVNAERVNATNLPGLFADWDVIYLDEVIDIGFTNLPYASEWIGMNLVMLDPDTAVVDASQGPLISALEARGVSVIPLRLRHARTLGGGFHCVTIDIRRDGVLEDYCHG